MLTAPAFPPVAAPDPIDIEPVLPELDVPELKVIVPATPKVPALDVIIVTAPEFVGMP
jgi:hypothetical protein